MVLPLIGAGISAIANLFGGSQAQKSQEKMAAQNIALQKEFAQSGIRWKVADAKAAGLHPLAALGAGTTSFSPVSIGSPMAGSLSSAGQDISRAMNSMATPNEKSSALEALTLERAGLENELLRTRIRGMRAAGSGPGLPGADKVQPPQLTSSLVHPQLGRVFSSPDFSDAQSYEDRFGEQVGDLYGFENWLHNMLPRHVQNRERQIYEMQRDSPVYRRLWGHPQYDDRSR